MELTSSSLPIFWVKMLHGGISLSSRYHIQRALQKHPTHCAGNVSAFVLSACKASITLLGNSPFIFAKLCSQLCPSITLRSLQPQTWLRDPSPPSLDLPARGLQAFCSRKLVVSVLLWEWRLKVKAMTCAAWWLAACAEFCSSCVLGAQQSEEDGGRGRRVCPIFCPVPTRAASCDLLAEAPVKSSGCFHVAACACPRNGLQPCSTQRDYIKGTRCVVGTRAGTQPEARHLKALLKKLQSLHVHSCGC